MNEQSLAHEKFAEWFFPVINFDEAPNVVVMTTLQVLLVATVPGIQNDLT